MAVDMGTQQARSGAGSNDLCLQVKRDDEPYDSRLLLDLINRASLAEDLMDDVLRTLNKVFHTPVPKRRLTPTLNGPRLIRERGTCPHQVPEGVVGLLNVGELILASESLSYTQLIGVLYRSDLSQSQPGRPRCEYVYRSAIILDQSAPSRPTGPESANGHLRGDRSGVRERTG